MVSVQLYIITKFFGQVFPLNFMKFLHRSFPHFLKNRCFSYYIRPHVDNFFDSFEIIVDK